MVTLCAGDTDTLGFEEMLDLRGDTATLGLQETLDLGVTATLGPRGDVGPRG